MDAADPNTTPPSESGSPFGFSPSAERPGPRWSGPARAAFLFTGVVLPIICFAIGSPDPPDWQSGNLRDYAQLLLAHKPASPLYPFLLYNMTCLMLLAFAPGRFLKNFVVRFGVYTGVLITAQYWLIFVISLGGATVEGLLIGGFYSLLAIFFPWAVGWLILFLWRKFRRFCELVAVLLALVLLLLLGIAIFCVAIESDPSGIPVALFAVPCILSLLCATPWAVTSYTIMAIYAARHSGVKRMRFSLARLMGVVTWLAAFLGAWRSSVLWMFQEYAKLPTEPPDNCYICTAAARGHRRLVAAEDYADPCGRVYRVNDQMRYLKAAELLLAGVSPRSHRVCRRAYDLIGPVLAATLIHPLLADAAYLSLKPAEWLCRAGLALLLPGRGQLLRSIYWSGSKSFSNCNSAAT
jgi:hypothetical protein